MTLKNMQENYETEMSNISRKNRETLEKANKEHELLQNFHRPFLVCYT